MKALLWSLLAALMLASAYGLRCYVCETHDSGLTDNPPCGDTFDKERDENKPFLVTCNATDIFCRKQKTGANHIWTKIERGCARQCEEKNSAYVDRVTCCESDGCNGAGLPSPAFFSLLGAALLGLIYRLL